MDDRITIEKTSGYVARNGAGYWYAVLGHHFYSMAEAEEYLRTTEQYNAWGARDPISGLLIRS